MKTVKHYNYYQTTEKVELQEFEIVQNKSGRGHTTRASEKWTSYFDSMMEYLVQCMAYI